MSAWYRWQVYEVKSMHGQVVWVAARDVDHVLREYPTSDVALLQGVAHDAPGVDRVLP